MADYCLGCEGIGVCDFCEHYNFNGDHTGAYTGHGFCRVQHTMISPAGFCEQYRCASLSNDGVLPPSYREILDEA